jgi:F0F1-type ATP synthase assembly protein I
MVNFILKLIASLIAFIAVFILLMVTNAPVFLAIFITIVYVAIIAILCAEKKNQE